MAVIELFPSVESASIMEMWPKITSAFQPIWAYLTSTQIITAGFNLMILVPIAVILIGCMRLFATGRGVLLISCLVFATAGMVDWFHSLGSLYYYLLGFSFTLVLLAAFHVYMVEGDINSEILWLYQGIGYIGSDSGLHRYSSNRLRIRQRINRERRYQQRPIPPTPSAAEVEEKAARLRQLQGRCERSRILAHPLRLIGPGGEAGITVPVEALARTPVNANSFAEPEYEPENIERHTIRQVDLGKRSGRYLLQWLAREIQESEGFIVPVRWSQCKRTGEITCYNGYAQINRPIPVDFFANSDDLIIGSVSVIQPAEIQPALHLINTALDYIKFYDTSAFEVVETGNLQSHSEFRRAVSVKCEFKRYPAEFKRDSTLNLDVDDPNWVEDPSARRKNKYVEKDRELVSLLTVSVDRYLVVTFHLAYMLEHPTAETCRELDVLFRDLIFNRQIIKIFHNAPNSVAALDATLEHIFRGFRPTVRGAGYATEMRRYNNSLRKPFRDTIDGPLRNPHYKDTGPDTFLNVNRPTVTEFERREMPCPLGLHGPGVDYAGRRCPCYLGILDITSVLDFILRQHRFISKDPGVAPKRGETVWPALASWVEPREGCGFEKLAQWMLAGSKYQPLLCRFRAKKTTEPEHPDVTRLGATAAIEAVNIYKMRLAIYRERTAQLYTSFGETKGIEKDDECLSYVIGDAIGLALIFRYLLTVESARLTAERLSHYGYRETLKIEPFAYETALYRPPLGPLRLPPLVMPNTHTIGLEVDVRSEREVLDYPVDEIYQQLAARPWWYMKRDTHWRAAENYGRVISSRFNRTGWQYPAPLEAAPPEILTDGNNDQPIRCRNLAAQIFRNNAANLPQNLVEWLLRASHFSNGTLFWAFACLLEWHCGVVSLMLPAGDLAIIYNEARPVPAEVTFRAEFLAFVRATGMRAPPQPIAARRRPRLPPTPVRLPETPPRGQILVEPTTTPSPPHRPRWGFFGWRTGPEVPVYPNGAPPNTALPNTAPGEWSWRRPWRWGPPAAAEVPQPENGQPPEGYIVRVSRTTGRLFWYNRQQGDSIWPNTAVALAAERRAVDATATAEQAVGAANEQLTAANDAAAAAETSAREAAAHANVTRQQNCAADVVLRTTNVAATARVAADAAAERQRNARNAFARLNQYADSTTAALRTGRADIAVDAARQATEIVAAVRQAAEAALQHAAEAAAAAQRAFGFAAPGYATIATAAQEFAEQSRERLRAFPPTQALFDQFLIRQMDLAGPVPLPANLRPPAITALENVRQMRQLAREAQAAVADASVRLAAVVDQNGTREETADATVAVAAARDALTTARQALTATARAAGIILPDVPTEVVPADQAEAARSAVVLDAHEDALERALEIGANFPGRLATLNETAETSTAAAATAQLRSTEAAAAAAALGPEPAPEPEPVVDVSMLIAVPIPEQHDFMDGVCAEILIYMLVQEISQYEALDDERRRFFGFAEMEDEYRASAKSLLWDHPAVKSMTKEAGLGDGPYDRLSYAEPYWFKRLQVLLGHDFACCVPLNSPDTTICRECGAQDRYELLEMLIAELERIRKLADVQVKLRDAYGRIYQEARQKMWIRARFQKPRPVPTLLIRTDPEPGYLGLLWTRIQNPLGGVLSSIPGLWAGLSTRVTLWLVDLVILIGSIILVLWAPIRTASVLRTSSYRSFNIFIITIVNIITTGIAFRPTRIAALTTRWVQGVIMGAWIIPQVTLGLYILYYVYQDLFQPEISPEYVRTLILGSAGLWLVVPLIFPPILPLIQASLRDEWAEIRTILAEITVLVENLRTPRVVVQPIVERPVVAPPIPARIQHENEWVVPAWCRCLLKTPLSIEPGYPRPSSRRLHRDWLQATIILLHLNPQTGAETWNCLIKWWQQGLRVQAVALADENVHQFDFPSMSQVTDETPQLLPNFGVNVEAVAARRVHNADIRRRVTVAHQSDYELALAAARVRQEQDRRQRPPRPPRPPPPPPPPPPSPPLPPPPPPDNFTLGAA